MDRMLRTPTSPPAPSEARTDRPAGVSVTVDARGFTTAIRSASDLVAADALLMSAVRQATDGVKAQIVAEAVERYRDYLRPHLVKMLAAHDAVCAERDELRGQVDAAFAKGRKAGARSLLLDEDSAAALGGVIAQALADQKVTVANNIAVNPTPVTVANNIAVNPTPVEINPEITVEMPPRKVIAKPGPNGTVEMVQVEA